MSGQRCPQDLASPRPHPGPALLPQAFFSSPKGVLFASWARMAEFQVVLSPSFKHPQPNARPDAQTAFPWCCPKAALPTGLSVCVRARARTSLHLEMPRPEVPDVTGPVEDGRRFAVPGRPRPHQGVAVSATPPPCSLRLPPSSDGTLPAGHKEGDWILERFRVRDDVPVSVRLHQHR